ncbi:MAG TPA: TonB-dependent receptor, partial [Steroidobacteraceae bacterium]|nr:TonB-dependent receptor [Steroidobacteraceae bacterium]
GTVQNIQEKIYAPYLSLAQTTEIGGMKLQTVIGARYESTELSTAAISKLPTSLAPTPGDPTNFTVLFGPQALVTSSTNYRYLLPSLDLNLQITSDLKARFDASRTMTRAPLNQINPTLNLPTAERVNSLVANGGNPNLLPFLSDNVDFGVEWYYAPNSYISVDGFVKEVSNFIVAGTVTEPIGGVTDPTHGGQVAQFSVTTNVNGPSAEVRGIEIGVQHMLWDTGFGVQANATFVDTSNPYDPANTLVSNFAVPGLANSANFVAFFEKWGFHARVAVNWEDSYLARFGQQQNTGNFGTEPTFVDSATFVDFSTSYDVSNNLSVFFEGLNLTDETYSTHGRYKAQVLDAIDTGPRLTFGARYKF